MTVRVGIVGSGFMGRTWAEVAASHSRGTSLSAITGGRRAAALASDMGVPLEPRLETLLARDDVEGAIGEVRMIQLTGAEVGWWDLAARGDAWKLDPSQQTAWASWGAHSCDLLRWFSGADGELAFARITNFSGEPPDVGQSAVITYEMTSGVLAQILMSYEFPPPGLSPSWRWRIVGSTGIIELDPYAYVRLGRGDGWEVVAEQAPFDPMDASDPIRLRAYARQLEDLVAAIVEGRDPLVSGQEGRSTTAMLDAAERSAASGTSAAVA